MERVLIAGYGTLQGAATRVGIGLSRDSGFVTFLARYERMDDKAMRHTVLRRAIRAYLIGAIIAIAVTVLFSLGAPLLPLSFAYRLTVSFGGIAAYGAYKRAAVERQYKASQEGNEKVAGPGWTTILYLSLIVVFGSGLLVVVTAAIFNGIFKLITGSY